MKVRVAPSCGIIGELRLSAANLLVKLLLQMLLLLINLATSYNAMLAVLNYKTSIIIIPRLLDRLGF